MTAIEWLKKELESYGDPSMLHIDWKTLDELCEKAKEMEKAQISTAWNDGNMLSKNPYILQEYSNGRQYYNKNYNKKK